MYYSSLIAGLLPALALAAPTAPTTNVGYTATFEDLNGDPVTPIGTHVGVYRGLNFRTFELFQQAIEGEGLEPNTRPNTATWGSVTGQTGELTANYDGSNVVSYDLQSLYFGCSVATQESTVNLPSSCTVLFTAQDKSGNQLAQQTESFDGSTEMQFVEFGSSFKNVYTVTFEIQGTLSNLLVVGATDTVSYTVHSAPTQAD